MAFRINYENVIKQSNLMSESAASLASQLNILTQIEQDTRNIWKGEASDVFRKRLNELKENINKTRKDILSLSSTIKYCAEQIRRVEEQATQNAAKLK